MATGDGWYVIGPLIAVAMVGALGLMFWRVGVDWIEQADEPLRETYGLSIFGESEDYGLLCPAAITDEPAEAEEIRLLLADAGIRSTQAVRTDGRLAVLVFGEELEAALRLVR
jgi:hypothetical protein